MMSTLNISLFCRLIRVGVTPPSWMSSALCRTMKSARACVVSVSGTTSLYSAVISKYPGQCRVWGLDLDIRDKYWPLRTLLDLLPPRTYWELSQLCQERNNKSFNNSQSCKIKIIFFKLIYILTLIHSGPQSCLCSELAECRYTADNELEVLPNIFQVKIFQLEEIFYFCISRRRPASNFVPPTLSVATTLGRVNKKI